MLQSRTWIPSTIREDVTYDRHFDLSAQPGRTVHMLRGMYWVNHLASHRQSKRKSNPTSKHSNVS